MSEYCPTTKDIEKCTCENQDCKKAENGRFVFSKNGTFDYFSLKTINECRGEVELLTQLRMRNAISNYLNS